MRLLALLLACSLTTGCASLKRETHTVCVQTEPAGAQVAVLEPDGRKELGPSPAEYTREIDTYSCGNVAWLIPVASTLLAGGAGFGLAYATTSFNGNDRVNAGWNTGALFAAVGLAVGIAVAAECRMKDGEAAERKDVRLLFEATQDGYAPASAPLTLPAETNELKLVLPPLGGAPATDAVTK